MEKENDNELNKLSFEEYLWKTICGVILMCEFEILSSKQSIYISRLISLVFDIIPSYSYRSQLSLALKIIPFWKNVCQFNPILKRNFLTRRKLLLWVSKIYFFIYDKDQFIIEEEKDKKEEEDYENFIYFVFENPYKVEDWINSIFMFLLISINHTLSSSTLYSYKILIKEIIPYFLNNSNNLLFNYYMEIIRLNYLRKGILLRKIFFQKWLFDIRNTLIYNKKQKEKKDVILFKIYNLLIYCFNEKHFFF